MSDTIIVTDDDTDETESVEDAIEDVEDAVDDIADAVDDAVMDSTTIQLVERVTRVEDALSVISGSLEALNNRLEETVWKTEMAQSSADIANERISDVAEEAADAIQDTTEEVIDATDKESEEGTEITEDEVPSAREHPFFRRWGKR